MNVKERADLPWVDRVIEFLAAQRAVLVVDNCEHVLPSVAELV